MTAEPTRRSAGARPNRRPRKDLREAPTSTARSNEANLSRRAMRSRQPCGLLPNPMPGSIAWRSAGIPAASAASQHAARVALTSPNKSSYRTFDCIVRGLPRMCMSTTAAPAEAATSRISGSRLPPLTSLTMTAPSSTAAAATAAREVSIEIGRGHPRSRSACRTGTTRASSSSTVTPAEPGRVLSPPMSRTSAPSSIASNARATAASTAA